MNTKQGPCPPGIPALVDYLILIAKAKELIALVAASCIVLALIAGFLLPSVYVAETRILPAESDRMAPPSQLLSQLGEIALAGGFGGGKGVGDLYAGLLQSRTVLDHVVERLNLQDVYDVKYRADARGKLLEALHIDSSRKSGILTISVEDRDPKRAADLANAFVEELKRLTQEIAVTEASRRRLFYEEKLKEIKESLIRSEEALKGYQERTGAVEIKEQAKAIIESVAKLRAQIVAAEVRLKVLRSYATKQNPDLQKTEEELQGLKEQLVKMETKSGDDPDPLMSTGALPKTGTGYVRKMRDLKFNEALFEIVTKQYELAKIDESRNSAIQVVDRAVPPEKRLKPKRLLMAAFAGLFGLAAGIAVVFLREKKEMFLASAPVRAKIDELKRHAALRLKWTPIRFRGGSGAVAPRPQPDPEQHER